MKDASTLFKIFKVRMSRYLDTSTEAQMAQIMVQYGRPSRFFSKGICTVVLWQDYYGKGNLRKFCWITVGKSFQLWMFSCQPSKRTIPISAGGRYQTGRQNSEMGRQNRKHRTDLENSNGRRWLGRTSIISWPRIFGMHSESVKSAMKIVANDKDMFESRISAGAKEKLPTWASGKLDAETISSWSYDMEGHAKKCVERYCELAHKTTQQLYKVATPCMDDHQF